MLGGTKKRLTSEINTLQRDAYQNIDSFEAYPNPDDIQSFDIILVAPENSWYANGRYNLRLVCPKDYPFKPPKVTFLTPIMHPNIDPSTGAICLSMIGEDWHPAINIVKALFGIWQLLICPDFEHFLN